MQQLTFFLQKYKYFLLFLLLEFIALSLTFNNLNFHNSKFVNSANSITGGLYSTSSNFSDYIDLKDKNLILSEENTKLKNQLERLLANKDSITETTITDTIKYNQKYSYINGKIVKNQFNKKYNFPLINRGSKHSVTSEMAVINSKGIIGITDNVSNGYARIQSILNKNSKINARVKHSNHFGSLEWNGENYNIVQLKDLPRQAVIKVGDTVETDGKSAIFPEGIPIGVIEKINKGNTVENNIDIKLFNDMSNLRHVYIIKNLHKTEIRNLENE